MGLYKDILRYRRRETQQENWHFLVTVNVIHSPRALAVNASSLLVVIQ